MAVPRDVEDPADRERQKYGPARPADPARTDVEQDVPDDTPGRSDTGEESPDDDSSVEG